MPGQTAAARERAALRRRLRRSERLRRLEAALLVAPLFLYLLVFFLVPILGMLWRSVDNTELRAVMPRTAQAIGQWDGEGLPDEPVFATFAGELRAAYEAKTLAVAAKRLAYDVSGFRSLMLSTARKLPEAPAAGSWRATLIELDPQWGETLTWAAIRRAAPPWTPIYLLAALDRQIDERGEIVPVRAGPGDLRRHFPAHLLDQLRGHGALPAARLSACLQARVAAGPHQQPAADPRAAAVLDVAARAHRRLGGAAPARGRGQRRPDRARPDQPSHCSWCTTGSASTSP